MECLKELREWLTAFGTVGAVVVALWFGLHGTRQEQARQTEERRRQLVAARLYAGGITAQLSYTLNVVASCLSQVINEDPKVTTDESNALALMKVKEWLAAEIFRPSPEGLMALTVAGGDLSWRLAKAFDHLELIRRRAAALPDEAFNFGQNLAVHRGMEVQLWREELMKTQALLQLAVEDCKRLMEMPPPVASSS